MKYFKAKHIIYIICLLYSSSYLFCCKSETGNAKAIQSVPVPNKPKTKEDTDKLLKKRILTGDTIAYFELRRRYIERNEPMDFLPWALIMANKYKLESSYYDVFFCIQEINTYYGEYLPKSKSYTNYLDSATIEFSRQYLNKMSDKEDVKSDWDFYSKSFSNPMIR